MKTNKQPGTLSQAVFWGIVSIAAYLLVFLNQQTVINYTARGGFYAAVVIAIAFTFSFIHGAFANYLVEAMGFKAVKKSKGGL